MPVLSANGVRLHYRIVGEGPPVLLLHPIGLDLSCWDRLVRDLRPEFQTVAIDLRGHGLSDMPPPPYSLGDFAGDLHSLLHTLHLAPAHLVGLSLGGMVAQELALAHPGDVRSLVLAGTACTFSSEGRGVMVGRAEAAERGGMESVVQSTLERWFTPAFLGSGVVELCRRRLLADRVEAFAATWRAISELDTEPRLEEIRVPTLAITGDADIATPVSAAETIVRRIPGARLHVLPGAPHMAPLERPDLFNPPVLGFLRGVQTPVR